MNVVCPSCQASFEADDDLAGGPGLPLCDDCSMAVRAPRAPAVAAPSAAPKPLAKAPIPPTPFDDGAASGPKPRPPSVPEPAAAKSNGGDAIPAPALTDEEDWLSPSQGSPSAEEPTESARGMRAGRRSRPRAPDISFGPRLAEAPEVRAIETITPEVAPESATPPSSAAQPISLPASELVSSREPERREQDDTKASAGAKKRKPSFFDVDSTAAPSDDAALPVEERRPPDSGHEDLRRLMAAHEESSARHGNSDIFGLHGALFGDAPRAPAMPLDLTALIAVDEGEQPPSAPVAPVLTLDRSSNPERPTDPKQAERSAPILEPSHDETASIPRARAPSKPAPTEDPTPGAPAPPGPKSVAPGPVVVAERRAAAARRGGFASWAVVASVALVSALAIGVGVHLGASAQPAPVVSEVAPPAAVVTLPSATASLTAAPAPLDPPPPSVEAPRDRAPERREPPAAPAPRAFEPAHAVVEPRTAVAPSPPAPALPSPAAATGGEFDRSAARAALARAAAQAAGCKQPDDPAGGAKVTVTFSPSGRATSAQVVGAPFQGTKTGACIAITFRSASVPPFEGDSVVVSKDVSLR
jgi:hypothetical protein